MGEGDVENPLKSLEKKIEKAKKEVEPEQPVQNKFSAAEVGWRMIIELTAGVFRLRFRVWAGFFVWYKASFHPDFDTVWVCGRC
jgi:hypothetical protein